MQYKKFQVLPEVPIHQILYVEHLISTKYSKGTEKRLPDGEENIYSSFDFGKLQASSG